MDHRTGTVPSMNETTEQPLLVLYRNRDQDNDTYSLHYEGRELIGRSDLPTRVVLGRGKQDPRELTEPQRDALVEILTGLRGEALRNYSVEIWLWDDSLIEKWW